VCVMFVCMCVLCVYVYEHILAEICCGTNLK
jgi:hypothetical protein